MWTKLAILALYALLLPAEEQLRPRYYQTRLLDYVSSELPPESDFVARVAGPLRRPRSGDLPRDTLIHGAIRRTQAVGLGVKRERATLELEFNRCELPSGEPIACEVQLVEIDNARERVSKSNTIHGIVAASHPHSWMSGVWLRPTPALFGKSGVGLTGAGGIVHSKVVPNPAAAAAIIGVRSLLFRLPEPEIQLPAGTDLILKVTHPAPPEESSSRDVEPLEVAPETVEALQVGPVEVLQSDGTKAADIINFAFLGSRKELGSAFESAGWTEAEPLTPKTFARTYRAFAAMDSYAAAPVSPMSYEGRLPDAVFQKAFNTLAKRHHIRFWRTEIAGETFWLGAATHDVAIGFEWNRFSLTHRIDRHIDRERSVILNDLAGAGCIDSAGFMERPELRTAPRQAGPRITDGALAIVKLQPCDDVKPVARPKRKRRMPYTLARRIVLETRHYVTRGNPYYYAYRALRWTATKRVAPSPLED